jgi:hypothetical protein
MNIIMNKMANEMQDLIYYCYFKVDEYNKIYHHIYIYNFLFQHSWFARK